jgi:hypothetical protein
VKHDTYKEEPHMERTIRVDDLDGRVDDGEIQPRTFALDGTVYDIDLHDENMERLREAMASFVAVARPRNRSVGLVAPARGPARIDKEQRDFIREWAKKHTKFQVAERGKIPDDVMEAFQKWGKTSPKEPSPPRERGREELVAPDFGGRAIFSEAASR